MRLCQTQNRDQTQQRYETVVIYTDSVQAIRILRGRSYPYNMHFDVLQAEKLEALADQLQALGLSIELRWVPGHAMNFGNELAHKGSVSARRVLAKENAVVHRVVSSKLAHRKDVV